MGQEIQSAHFSQADFEQFYRNLQAETNLLKKWFAEGVLDCGQQTAGLELEAWLLDQEYKPAAINDKFLKQLDNPLVVPELSLFNVELNSTPHALEGSLLSDLYNELQDNWEGCYRCATELDSKIAMIGILPTLEHSMLTMKNMSPMQRYYALNEQIFRLRNGRAMNLDIQGRDHLKLSPHDVMFESATTSVQVHLQFDPAFAVRAYNASLILSAPTVAVAANSPYLFGHELWDETRIPLFEQAVDVGSVQQAKGRELRRVTFGSSYIKSSLYECFLENLISYPVLLPAIFQQGAAQMTHLKLHNGTIWRWNRPLIGTGTDGRVHLRLEHRVMAAGPTVSDVIANIALYIGLTQHLATQETPPETRLSFEEARDNFYSAARDGLNARIKWLDGKQVSVQSLLLNRLIPMAEQGLRALGIDKAEIDHYLKSIIQERVRTEQNGAYWQKKFVQNHPGDLKGLTMAYIERQQQGDPVHRWSV